MSIIIDEKKKLFHLQGKEISYVFTILENDQLGHVYFGKKLPKTTAFNESIRRTERALTSSVFEGDSAFSLDVLPQEYPSYGTTDYRHPAFQVQTEFGDTITSLKYKGYTLKKGKPSLKGLPAIYAENESEAETLEITLKDDLLNLKVVLQYSIFHKHNAVMRNTRFINHGEQTLHLKRAQSSSIDFQESDFQMIQLSGAWARERHITESSLKQGIQSIESTRGASSAFENPFLALKRRWTTENNGEVYGFSLIYSGNFLGEVEVNAFDQTRVTLGINPFDFNWKLEPKEEFQTPESVLAYSEKGLNGLSQTYHHLYRTRLARGKWRDKERPILVNNWEATYFDFTEESILSLAKEAQHLGIELFVLDDGWFGKRNNDHTSLGDWYVNKRKLPHGLKYLAEEINQLGMGFGLWFEPEMVNKDSELYKEHPEWIIQVPKRELSHGRNQYVLDYTRKEVRNYIFEQLAEILHSAPITYIKWDMNRNMTEIGSLSLENDRQKEVSHRYILGLYELLEQLQNEFPDVLFESCSSGGNRFDPGMLYYMPQTWTSDNTDAIERLKIQYGTSFAYPLSSMGAHVSAVPNHQVGRWSPLKTRGDVSFFGMLGYELDLRKLSKEEKNEITSQIQLYKKHRKLVHTGNFYRLVSPFEENYVAWMVVSKGQNEALVGYYKILATPNSAIRRVKLFGLDDEREYVVRQINEKQEKKFNGLELKHLGLPIPIETRDEGDFNSFLWHIESNKNK